MSNAPEKKFVIMLCQFPGGMVSHPDPTAYIAAIRCDLQNDPRVTGVIPFTVGDTPITRSRNLAIKKALEYGADYVLMIDSDVSPDQDRDGAKPFWKTAWRFMMDRRTAEITAGDHEVALTRKNNPAIWTITYAPATIAAPYCGPPPHEIPYIGVWRNMEGSATNPSFSLQMMSREEAGLRTGIEEVAALPTGLILYDIRLFKELPKPWFDYEWGDPEQTEKVTTEDIFQTRNASLMGFPQYVAWDCWAGHWKLKYVGAPEPYRIHDMRKTFTQAVALGNIVPPEKKIHMNGGMSHHAHKVREWFAKHNARPLSHQNVQFETIPCPEFDASPPNATSWDVAKRSATNIKPEELPEADPDCVKASLDPDLDKRFLFKEFIEAKWREEEKAKALIAATWVSIAPRERPSTRGSANTRNSVRMTRVSSSTRIPASNP